MNNINWSNDGPKDDVPNRKFWRAVILQAYKDALCVDEDEKQHRYEALAWFFDGPHKEYRNRVADYADQDIKSWQKRLENVLMHKNMEDHITDMPQTPEDDPEYEEPEDLYEQYKQGDLDALDDVLFDIARSLK